MRLLVKIVSDGCVYMFCVCRSMLSGVKCVVRS